jgi:type I restriction enzyme, R subunit
MAKEAKARILINNLLQRAGWRFFDDESGPAKLALEANVKIKKNAFDEFGDDFEKLLVRSFSKIISCKFKMVPLDRL